MRYSKITGVTYDEFVEMVTPRMLNRDAREEIMKVFALFDDDNTGGISYKNLKRVATELGENLTDEELQEMIDEADRDDDGISTPGSVLTPERATSHKKNLATTTPSSAAGGDKYFFTPSSHIKSTNGTNNKFIITTPLSPNSLLLANTKANQSSYSPESPNK